jgi:hypothetical protein
VENEFLELHRKASEEFHTWYSATHPIIRDAYFNGYAIDDAEARNKLAPERYPIPSRTLRERCSKGELVVLLLITLVQLEHAWTVMPEFVTVKIQTVFGGWYHGPILDGLQYATRTKLGQSVDFKPRHIVALPRQSSAN